jgi:GT2 family glycosyltransferase
MAKKVAVILVNWNGFSLTADCIESLMQVSYPDFDIVVVDNASADRSGSLLKEKYPQIVLIQSPENTGFAGGNNQGIAYAISHAYPYTLILNNDTFVAPDLLDLLTAEIEKEPAIAAVQPLIYFHHNRSKIWNGGSFYQPFTGITYTHTNPQKAQQPCKVDWVTGCAFLVRTDVLKKTGPFAANLFMYYEDVDLSFRMVKAGYALRYCPSAVVYHIAGASGKTEQQRPGGTLQPIIHYYTLRNRIWLLKKYTRIVYVPGVVLVNFAYIVGLIAYFSLRFRFSKLAMVIKAVRDGLSGRIIYS